MSKESSRTHNCKTQNHHERQESLPEIKDETVVCIGHSQSISTSVNPRITVKNPRIRKEMLQNYPRYLPCRNDLIQNIIKQEKNPIGRPCNHCQKVEVEMVWTC